MMPRLQRFRFPLNTDRLVTGNYMYTNGVYKQALVGSKIHTGAVVTIDTCRLPVLRLHSHLHCTWGRKYVTLENRYLSTCNTEQLSCSPRPFVISNGRSCSNSQFSEQRQRNNRIMVLLSPAKQIGSWKTSWNSNICRQFHSSSDRCVQLKPLEKWKPGTMAQVEVPSMSNLAEFEDKLFDYLCDDDGTLKIATFKNALISTGLRETDPRLAECMKALTHTQTFIREHNTNSDGTTIDKEYFKECISENIVIIAKAFQNQMIVPDFGTFCEQIDEIYWKARENIAGEVATYIPQLARYSPKLWGVAVCTIDGQRYSVGDVNVPLCLQSISKPLNYAMVLDDLTPEVVHQYVGQEPSGTSFNSISLDYKDKPHNPMINAGAIVLCSLLKQAFNQADRFDYVTQMYKRVAGGEYLAFNNSVFLSEKETADRNFALAYYMREKKCFPQGSNLMEVLDFYFQLCSLEVTCESGSVIAATLANGGICPITGDKVFSSRAVRDTLSLMLSCGMYDYSGEFAFTVGLPAKSGVSGGIMLVVPNKMGMFVWSPALDSWGNSVRGVQFSQELVAKFNFHHYDNLRFTPWKIDPCKRKIEQRSTDVVNLLFSSYNNDVSALRRFALGGLDMDQSDYDGRTALHIAAAEGHANVVQFLLVKCKCSPNVVDRWGFKPFDDAVRFKHNKVAKMLELAMATYDAEAKIDRRFEAIDSTKYGEVTFGRDTVYSDTAVRSKVDKDDVSEITLDTNKELYDYYQEEQVPTDDKKNKQPVE